MRPANEVYEVAIAGTKKRWRALRFITVLIGAIISLGDGPANPGGRNIVIRALDDGSELARIVEDWGDDENNLLIGIERDLATMTAREFASAWLPTTSV